MGVFPPNNTPSFGEPQYHRPGLAEPTYRVPGVGIGLGATVPGTEPGLGTYVGSDLPPPPSCGNSDNWKLCEKWMFFCGWTIKKITFFN